MSKKPKVLLIGWDAADGKDGVRSKKERRGLPSQHNDTMVDPCLMLSYAAPSGGIGRPPG